MLISQSTSMFLRNAIPLLTRADIRKGVILEDSPKAAASPSGIYTEESIEHFARSDRYNELYRRLSYAEVIKKYQLQGKLIDLGAACGGSALVWRELGFEVLGVDLREYFVDVMREAGLRAEVVDVTDIAAELGDETFDVAYGSGLSPQVRRIRALNLKTYQSIHRALNPGGFFIFDSASLPGEYNPASHKAIIESDGLFELMEIRHLKGVPARFYRPWNMHVFYSAEKYLMRHVFGVTRRYILRRIG